ncbi:hypothetical protein ES319_A03G155700v1, partial [Gossypium barbadense]
FLDQNSLPLFFLKFSPDFFLNIYLQIKSSIHSPFIFISDSLLFHFCFPCSLLHSAKGCSEAAEEPGSNSSSIANQPVEKRANSPRLINQKL